MFVPRLRRDPGDDLVAPEVGVDERRALGDPLLDVEDRRERLVVDLDEGGRLGRGLGRLGGDGRHRVADEADAVGREDRLVLEVDAGVEREVAPGDDGAHARDRAPPSRSARRGPARAGGASGRRRRGAAAGTSGRRCTAPRRSPSRGRRRGGRPCRRTRAAVTPSPPRVRRLPGAALAPPVGAGRGPHLGRVACTASTIWR